MQFFLQERLAGKDDLNLFRALILLAEKMGDFFQDPDAEILRFVQEEDERILGRENL